MTSIHLIHLVFWTDYSLDVPPSELQIQLPLRSDSNNIFPVDRRNFLACLAGTQSFENDSRLPSNSQLAALRVSVLLFNPPLPRSANDHRNFSENLWEKRCPGWSTVKTRSLGQFTGRWTRERWMSRFIDRNRGRDSSLRKRTSLRALRNSPCPGWSGRTHVSTHHPDPTRRDATLCNLAAKCQETLRFD